MNETRLGWILNPRIVMSLLAVLVVAFSFFSPETAYAGDITDMMEAVMDGIETEMIDLKTMLLENMPTILSAVVTLAFIMASPSMARGFAHRFFRT